MKQGAKMKDQLSGRWAVVTGGSKGIGLGIAEAFVGAGANVVLVARGEKDLDAAAHELRAVPGSGGATPEVRTYVGDTGDRAAIADLFTRLEADLPSLDVFVANAGAGVPRPFLEITPEEWDWCIDLNLTGTFLCVQAAARRMIADRSAGDADAGADATGIDATGTAAAAADGAGDPVDKAILVVSSIRALGARPTIGAYSAAKAGLNQMVRVAAYELAEHDVRVNTLSPGITATPLALEGNPALFEERAGGVPLRRAGLPADMAAGALYLCSPAARFVTGANLVVDGGESLW